jgi:AraC-like DNA-binding protein
VTSSLVDIKVVEIDPGSESHRSTCPDGQFWLPVRGEQVVKGEHSQRRQLPFELMYYAPREPAVRMADSPTLAYGLRVQLSQLTEEERDPRWIESAPVQWDTYRSVVCLLSRGLEGRADVHELDEVAARLVGSSALKGEESPRAPWLRRVEDLLEDDPSLTLVDLSRSAGVVPAYLSAEFSRARGVTVSRYRRRVMLRRALSLAGSLTLNEAAIEAGFYDASHFHRVCQAELDVKPTDLRRLIHLT